MTDYNELVKKLRDLHRDPRPASAVWLFDNQVALYDAADAIEALQKDLTTLQECYEIADKTVDCVLKQLPKRGEWKPFDLTYGRSIYSCSVCEQATEVPMCMEKPMYAFCPNCGAKMEVEG